ncbi:MAG: peptidoglycan-binding protein [Epsilonproteobacteria bacterium]|nr:peptidoglycan-binding protein [Campylobacterota bacterium]
MSQLTINDIPFKWIKKELKLPKTIKKGSKSVYVKYIQEWLDYHDFKTPIDQKFGIATKTQVKKFQRHYELIPNGVVDLETYHLLTQPMLEALSPIEGQFHSFSQASLAYAKQQMHYSPKEIGGENRGPWVRLYMRGEEGSNKPWCAGFVTFILKKTAHYTPFKSPIRGSRSCDTLAAQAKEKKLFISEQKYKKGEIDLPSGTLFLTRNTSTDWTHVGFVRQFKNQTFETIEGNETNNNGSQNDVVCSRERAYRKRDFIVLR